VEEVPEDDYEIELGKAKIVQEGTDVTLIGYGSQVIETNKAEATSQSHFVVCLHFMHTQMNTHTIHTHTRHI
jgi:pyruvate/2-oxoglutarate/acetoin dehydrogenase E1 component